MKRRFRCPVQTKWEFVVEVLSGYRTEAVTRQHGLSPKTLGNWVRHYQDEVDDLMVKNKMRLSNSSKMLHSFRTSRRNTRTLLNCWVKKNWRSISCGTWLKIVPRLEVALHWIGQGYRVRTMLRICGVPRSTYYYRLQHPEPQQPVGKGRPVPGFSYDKTGVPVKDARIQTWLRRLVQGPNGAFGYRPQSTLEDGY